MNDEEPLTKILVSFFDNTEDHQPDVKKLAQLLRMEKPLPDGFRWWLAEVLDPRFRHKLAAKWKLKPVYITRYGKDQQRDKKEDIIIREIDAAIALGLTIEEAINRIEEGGKTGWKHRTIQAVWLRAQRWRKGKGRAKRNFEDEARKYFEDEAAKSGG